MKIIEDGLSIEEAFELVILGYIDYESGVFQLNLEGLIRGLSEMNSNFFDNRRLLNRSISNFLSSSRAYVDQIEKLNSSYSNLKEKTISHEFDTIIVYPFMCKLRNYVQHCDVIIHEKIRGSFLLSEDVFGNEGGNRSHNSSLQLIIDKKRLEESTVFNKKALNPMPDKIFVTRTFREYLGCLLRIHKKVRDQINYDKNCVGITEKEKNDCDARKIDALLGLIRKNNPVDIIERTKMIGVQ